MLSRLSVRHFRCFEKFETEFAPGMNLIVGPNAQGKTSILEAACILLRLASPRVSRLAPVIQHEKRGFAVDGYSAARHLQFYFSRERKKLALDEVEQKSAHEYLQIGRIVYFSNNDIEIVRGSADVRRRFLDFIASQRDAGYRTALRNYERALRSRNLLLKASQPRWREIAAFDEPLLKSGNYLIAARHKLLSELEAPASVAHRTISGTGENLRPVYCCGAGDNFESLLAHSRSEDARLRQTSVGPHRDDMQLLVNDHSADIASEGQQRTLVLGLKLGAAQLLEEHFGESPLLLLDDIFGELDISRRNALLQALPAASQTLITTTHVDWMPPQQEVKLFRLG